MGMRLRLIISMGLALLATLGLGAALTFWHAAYKVQTEVQAAIAVGAQVAQSAVDDSVQPGANRRQRVERLVKEFDGDRHLRAFLTDRDDQIVLASNPDPPKEAVPAWFNRLLGGRPNRVQVALPPDFGDYGSVVLVTDASNELEEAWSDIGLALAELAIFCSLALGVVYWTLAEALRPLRGLSVAFASVGRGDYSARVAEEGAAEFVRIAREFNQMAVRLSTMRLQNDRLNVQLQTVQEEERATLARELHDEIGPFLFAVGLDVSTMHQIARSEPGLQRALSPRLDAIRDAVVHTQKHLKSILGRLKPMVLLDLGLNHAIDNTIDFWRGRYPEVVFDLMLCEEPFGEQLDEAIYWIVREAVSNALRHGGPSRVAVDIRLHGAASVSVTVTDDGRGMKVPRLDAGFGISGMNERAALLGGTLSIRNRTDGNGVVVVADLPLRGSGASSAPPSKLAVPA
jgi:two-component system sensor histidine kinase UhpB